MGRQKVGQTKKTQVRDGVRDDAVPGSKEKQRKVGAEHRLQERGRD